MTHTVASEAPSSREANVESYSPRGTGSSRAPGETEPESSTSHSEGSDVNADLSEPRTSVRRAPSSLSGHVPIYFIGRLVPSVLSFVSLSIFTRYLTPSAFGTYAIVIASGALVHALCFGWINASTIRHLHGAHERVAVLLLSGRYFLRISLAVVVLAVPAALLLPSGFAIPLLLGATLVVAKSWLHLNQGIHRAEERPRWYASLELSRAAIGLVVATSLASAGFGAEGVLVGVIVGYSLPGLATVRRIWSRLSRVSYSPSLERDFLRYGLPIIGTLALSYVVRSSDRLMIGWLSTTREAGLYAAGYDLSFQAIDGLLQVSNLAAFPLLLRAAASGNAAQFESQAVKNVLLLTALGLPATTGLVVLSGDISRTVLGADFAGPAAALLPLISLATLLSGYKSYYFDHAFHVGSRTIRLVYIGAVAAVANIVLNLLMIPRFGGIGAAWSTLICFGLALVLSATLGRSTVQLPLPWRQLTAIAAATAAMIVVLVFLPPIDSVAGLAAKILLGFVVYALGLLLLDVHEARGRLLALWRA
jgi:O-antigen/teichoic acid export membrane protein